MRIGVLSTLAILFCSRRGRPHHIEMALCAGTGLRYAIAYCEPVPNSIAPWMRVGGGQARASLCESRDPVPASTRAFDRCDFGVLASLAFLFCSRLEARTTPSEIATVNVQARKPAPQSNAINLFLLSLSPYFLSLISFSYLRPSATPAGKISSFSIPFSTQPRIQMANVQALTCAPQSPFDAVRWFSRIQG